MDFKGTKLDWKLDYPVIYADDYFQTHICEIPDIYTHQEAKANALLISKAPEMLEMLEKAKTELSRIKNSMRAHPDCTEGSEFDDYTSSAEECENNIEQLIKQATELCENT